MQRRVPGRTSGNVGVVGLVAWQIGGDWGRWTRTPPAVFEPSGRLPQQA